MLTKRQNLYEVMHGGNPDRFVNQYEAFNVVMTPQMGYFAAYHPGMPPYVNDWGVTNEWPEGTPGAFPVHTPDKVVIKDITKWRDYVHAPSVKWTDEEWAPYIEMANAVDRTQEYVCPFVAPGLFEQTHHLGEIKNTLMNFYDEPEDMHDLIKYLKDYELALAEEICSHLKPDGLFHHDDWGSQLSTFMSPDMFAEFYLEPYKEVYGYYKSHGVEMIVHHADSWAATLVPYMIEMGIDVWQGAMKSNNIPELIKKYGGKITFMAGIDSADVDKPNWTQADIEKAVKEACDSCGKHYFIPNITQGLAISTFPGVYEATTAEIDRYSKIYFGK